VTKVSSLSEGEIDVIEQPDGSSNTTHKISSGIIKFGDITIERNMDGTKADDDFKKWFSTMFMTDEELFVLRQHCMECRPRRSSIFPALIWALLVALLGALCVCLADLWHQ
jgi:hypothetical protein